MNPKPLKKNQKVVVRFPFTDVAGDKARPSVVISNEYYNRYSRNAIIILAITSQFANKLPFEKEIVHWKKSGLLKPSLFKASVATLDKRKVIAKSFSMSKFFIVEMVNQQKTIYRKTLQMADFKCGSTRDRTAEPPDL